ncbi:MAG: type II toxin-antitoxin system RelE/ParE family toxin [Nitrospirae bacterium]|nr:type II toxin-antitoxin system RelE/ParE family toxin [Nitrospirota bacterium]
MNWRIDFSKNALSFLKSNHLEESVILDKVKLAIRKFKGENANIDIKKLSGEWEGFHRIRVGKLRVIAEFQFERYRVCIEEIDWRGNVYK